MSKHVTFLVGNGFDLCISLKTRYTDFYKIYTNENTNDSNVIRRFKKEILRSEAHGWKNWMDFEMGMGQQSKHFDGETPVEDFIECFNDFAICFNKYLVNECETINWDAVDEKFYRNFVTSIRKFYSHIRSIQSASIQSLIQHSQNDDAKINFIQFNYTNIFDELIKKSNLASELNQLSGAAKGEINRLGANLHVHGIMNGGYPSIGVNDESQIESEQIRNDSRIHKIFIKPKFLDALQKRDANRNIARVDALKAITNSTVICAFGASIGDSDKYWWKKIGNWLKQSNGVLIIFDICGSMDDGISPLSFLNSEMSVEDRKKEIIERFARLADIDSKWLNENSDKILIELDSKMFSFRLPKNERLKNGVNEKDV